jgi:hypothetical protein
MYFLPQPLPSGQQLLHNLCLQVNNCYSMLCSSVTKSVHWHFHSSPTWATSHCSHTDDHFPWGSTEQTYTLPLLPYWGFHYRKGSLDRPTLDSINIFSPVQSVFLASGSREFFFSSSDLMHEERSRNFNGHGCMNYVNYTFFSPLQELCQLHVVFHWIMVFA